MDVGHETIEYNQKAQHEISMLQDYFKQTFASFDVK